LGAFLVSDGMRLEALKFNRKRTVDEEGLLY
jgi:hypothetical protein